MSFRNFDDNLFACSEFRFDTPQLVGVKRRSRFNGAAGELQKFFMSPFIPFISLPA